LSSSTTAGERIERSPADILRVVVAAVIVVVVVVIEWIFGDTLVGFASGLLRGFDAVPAWIVRGIVFATRALAVIVLGGGLVWAVVHRRWRMLVTVVTAGVVAGLLTAVIDSAVDTEQGRTVADVKVGPLGREAVATTQGIAVVAAALTAAAPWLSRRWRRAGWALIIGLVVIGLIDSPVSFDPIQAAFVGWVAGAAVLVALGAPSRRPTPAAVAAGLAGVGLPLRGLEQAGVDARGSTPYFGEGDDGGGLFVKALGTDERSADLLFRLYRTLQPRRLGDERPFSSLRRSVEHEAFVALYASSLGIKTPRLRAFASAEPNGFVLAYEAIAGRSLDRLDPTEMTDEVLGATWRLVAELRQNRIAHRDLRLANIFLDDRGEVWLIDFGFSEVAASDLLLANDVAELTASSSLTVGPERAVERAAAFVDAAMLDRARDRLHLWALSGATRTGLAARRGQLDELRDGLGRAAGPPTPATTAVPR
jgi:tRNA A-37 threonylcarbamoyl transferase component Bud32